MDRDIALAISDGLVSIKETMQDLVSNTTPSTESSASLSLAPTINNLDETTLIPEESIEKEVVLDEPSTKKGGK